MTKIIGHRGVPSLAPENTLSSFKLAIKLKLDFFEFDVRETKDGEIVSIHLNDIKKMTGMEGKISEMNYEDLKYLTFNYPEKFGKKFKGEKLPRLQDVLNLAKRKIKIVIELKADNIEEKVLLFLKKKRMVKESAIISSNLDSLKILRKNSKFIELIYLSNLLDEKIIDSISKLKVNHIAIGRGGIITKEMVEYGKKMNVNLWKFTIDNKTDMRRLIKENAYGIISNYPQKFLEIINPAPNNA